MICKACKRSAVGVALNGNAYCGDKTCFDWKSDLIEGRRLRAQRYQKIVQDHLAMIIRVREAARSYDAFHARYRGDL